MRSILRAAMAGGMLLLATAAVAQAKRVALVIGNGAYENFGQLSNPVRDATSLAETLGALDFDIIRLHTDVDLIHMLDALKTFRDDAAGADFALVFYAGHGQQAAGENYLFPIDSDPQDVVDLPREAVNLDEVIQNYLQRAGIGSSLVVLDACRDASLFEALQQRTRDMTLTRGFAPAQVVSSAMDYEIWYSTADGALANDGTPGTNSPFTAALLEALAQPGLDSDSLFRAVVARMSESGADQKPVTYGRFNEPLVLNPALELPTPTADTEPDAQAAISEPETPAIEATPDEATSAVPEPEEAATGEPEPDQPPIELAASDEPKPDTPPAPTLAPQPEPTVTDTEVSEPAEPEQEFDVVESEPNAPLGHADRVAPGDRVSGTIGDRGDHDFFVFDSKRAGLLRVVVETLPADLQLNFRLYDPDFSVTQNWGTAIAEPGGAAELVVPAPGTYRLEVADSGNDAVSFEPYVLALEYAAAGDALEPNNSFGTATPIVANKPFGAAIFPRYDEDHLLLTVDRQGELTLGADTVPEAIDLRFRVFDPDGKVLMSWTGAAEPGQPARAVVDLPAPGDYVVALADGGSDSASTVGFQVMPAFVPTVDGFEPNGSLGQAASIAPGASYEATILPRYDHDFYRLDIAEPGELTVVAGPVPENLDLAIRIFDPEFGVLVNWIKPSTPGQETRFVADLPRPGRYTLEVADGSDDARSVAPYALDVAFAPSPDATEPNGSFGQAVAIAADSETPLTILPRYDHDFLAVDLPREGRLTVRALEVPPELDVAIRVYDIHGGVLQNWVKPSTPGQDTVFVAEPPEAGRYVLEVSDGSDDARSVRPFVLESRFEPAPGVADGHKDAPVTIPLGTPVEAAIVPRYDHDFYDVPLDRPGRLGVSVQSPPELDMAFRVLDRAGYVLVNWIRAGAPGQPATGSVDVPEPGGAIIEIADGSDDASSVSAYILTVSLEQ